MNQARDFHIIKERIPDDVVLYDFIQPPKLCTALAHSGPPIRPVRSSLEYGIIYHRAYIEFWRPTNLQVIKHTF